MARSRNRFQDPDQFDLFEPPHERCQDGRGPYQQFLIAPPTELGEPGPWAAGSKDRNEREISSPLATS